MSVLPLGRSVYLSQPETVEAALAREDARDVPLFLSLHISEEMNEEYCAYAREVCRKLAEKGYRMIADVSVKTCAVFQQPDLALLARELGLYALRVDYGLETEAICALAGQIPVAVNASTVSLSDAARIARAGKQVFAIHNFYPRPETGLDRAQFDRRTTRLRELGYRVYAFIPGDEALRGPIREGLPTLEEHRSCGPASAYMDLCERSACDGVFVGDPGLSSGEEARIRLYQTRGILSLPCTMAEAYAHLLNRPFACREDSPASLVRVKESRVYSCQGRIVEPENCAPRPQGSITMDNARYLRYSGEVMITRQDFPADPRVNVIGQVSERGLPLLGFIGPETPFLLTPEKEQ